MQQLFAVLPVTRPISRVVLSTVWCTDSARVAMHLDHLPHKEGNRVIMIAWLFIVDCQSHYRLAVKTNKCLLHHPTSMAPSDVLCQSKSFHNLPQMVGLEAKIRCLFASARSEELTLSGSSYWKWVVHFQPTVPKLGSKYCKCWFAVLGKFKSES